MIGAQSDSIGTDARGPDPMAGDKSKDSMTQISLEVKTVFGCSADECAVPVAGFIHPSSGGIICSELRAGAAIGVIS